MTKETFFEQSPDPRLDEVKAHVAGISFGDTDVHDKLQPILSDASIFCRRPLFGFSW